MITQILCVVLGGLTRACVGSGLPVNKYLAYLLAALGCGYVGLGTSLDLSLVETGVLFWVSTIAALNLAAGYTRWECWWWQVLRFGLPSIALILPLLFQNPSPLLLLYPLCVASISAFYPMRQRAFDLLHLPERSFQIPFTKLSITLDSARLA